MSKKYWKGLPELHNSPEFQEQLKNEFSEPLPIDEFLNGDDSESKGTSRRDFLKVMGFSTAAVALAACETPVNRSIPYVVKPEEVTPGVANFYASTFYDGHDYASILVKTREGRPIKIEGNDLSKVSHGGTTARVQASVLSLYDGARLRGPMVKGKDATWKAADDAVAAAVSAAGASIRILTSTIISPSTRSVVAEFMSKYPTAQHVTYDAISYNALTLANKNVWGKSVVSSYDFSKAKTVVGIACDFLGNWLNPVEFAKQYATNRRATKEKPEMSKHYHFEATLSLTGANADHRVWVKPSELGKVTLALYNEIAKETGNAKVSGDEKVGSNPEATKAIEKAAEGLLKNKGQSLVVSGVNDEGIQTLVNGINKMLDNYGKTVDVEMHYNLKQGDDKAFADLVADMAAGKVNVLLTYNCNPVYTAPAALNFAAAYKKVGTKVSFAQVLDETAQWADVVCPDNHYLESWNDANPKRGHYSLQQPAINPIFAQPRHEGTRQFQDSMLKWSGLKTDYLSYLQGVWNNRIFPNQGKFGDFTSFWNNSLHDGVVKTYVHKDINTAEKLQINDSTGKPLFTGVAAVVAELADTTKVVTPKVDPKVVAVTEVLPTPDYNKAAAMATGTKGGAMELFIYEKIGIGSGIQSNNPWLQELPDPISKVTWDNYITMSPIDVNALGLNEMLRQDKDGSIVELTANGVKMTVPVYPQPGQAPGTIGLALGYGRAVESMKVANGVGVNAFAALSWTNNTFQPIVGNVTVGASVGTHHFAATQIQHTIMGREEYILRETSIGEYKEKNKEYYNPAAELPVHGGGKKNVAEIDLWNAHERLGHKWGMTIDMNTCIGCAACVVACTAENNVAVVGKVEVAKTRDMAWLRIDRYYSSEANVLKDPVSGLMPTRKAYLDMETPSANPKVTFQPMMCQHCNHAPCETVCPVLATSHSSEGLNMMTYNRCIGTRYCANNCPFKVRRFNWFNYNQNSMFADTNPAQMELGRMVLNPDVVVRSRGVMEKCSMCAQRVQAGKLVAKKSGMPLVDGSIKTACQQACPTNAIMFGDANDENSEVTKWRGDDKNYYLLEEIGVKPTVSYLLKVRNVEERVTFYAEEGHKGGHEGHEEKHEEHKEESHS